MIVHVLGSAAGGRFPRSDCGCDNCAGARAGTIPAQPRTQDSVAVSPDGAQWFVVNASPDTVAQIEHSPALHRRDVAAFVVANGDLDHVLGLPCPLVIYASRAVRAGLSKRFHGTVTCRALVPREAVPLSGRDQPPTGLLVAPFGEDSVGVEIVEVASGRRLVYVSAAASIDGIARRVDGADCVLFDGTCWSRIDGLAHVPISGPGGSLERLSSVKVRRRIYTHLHHTNPILREDSDERKQVEAAGWEVATDGLLYEV